jgi:DNA/RNA-binding domain of Phe-tRNA-synthetase-like protein
MIQVVSHPLLDLRAFRTTFPRPLGERETPAEWLALFRLDAADVPLRSDETVRDKVRDLLRAGGFKPTGRSKPASEYLLKAASEPGLSSINLAVDACNAVSLHSGLPISVVDLDRTVGALRVALAEAGASYVFNLSGQVIELGGLLCLMDDEGPCANAVKDAQRTKTSATTTRTLSLIWGSKQLLGRAEQAERWYRSLLEKQGCLTESEDYDTLQ